MTFSPVQVAWRRNPTTGDAPPLTPGASVGLCRNPGRLDEDGLAKYIESERVTNTAARPRARTGSLSAGHSCAPTHPERG